MEEIRLLKALIEILKITLNFKEISKKLWTSLKTSLSLIQDIYGPKMKLSMAINMGYKVNIKRKMKDRICNLKFHKVMIQFGDF